MGKTNARRALIVLTSLVWMACLDRAFAVTASISSPLRVQAGLAPELGTALQLDIQAYQATKAQDRFTLQNFAMPDGSTVDMDLERFDIYTPDAQVVLGTSNGDQPMARPDVLLLRGHIVGDADSRVFLGLSPHGTNGLILRGDRRIVLSEPPNKSGPIVICDLDALPPGTIRWQPFVCGIDQLANGGRMPELANMVVEDSEGPDLRDVAGCRIVKLAVETDFEYTDRVFSGNAAASSAYIPVLFAAVSEIYTYELQSRFQIVFSRVWGDDSDPYPNTSINSRLNEVGNVWGSSMGGIQRNIVHMLSGLTFGAGGIAYLGVLCPMPGGYGVSGYLGGSFPYPLQNNNPQNWDLVVVSHEIGHNFGSPHTHDVGVDCCGCSPQNCTNASTIGTIMSYCHTCPGGLANIALNFHSFMRNNYIFPYLNGSGGCVVFSTDVSFNAQPSGQAAASGDSVTLTANVTGGPPLNLQWRRDGVGLSDGGNIYGANGPTLVISTARSCDAGVYELIGTSSCSQVTSDPATVTVDTSGVPAPEEEAKPTAGDGADADEFGNSLALGDGTLVVGAVSDDGIGGSDQGAAYVYIRNGAAWVQQAKLVASDGSAGDFFGVSAALSGESAVIGAFRDSGTAGTAQGAAYVFTRNGSTWTDQAKLVPSDAAALDEFGTSVAISGDTAVVGSPYNDGMAGNNQGAAYVFVRSGAVWSEQAKLTASDAAVDDNFGYCVAIDGDSVVVGAVSDDAAAGTDQGSAYVFVRSGSTWTEQAKLTATDAAAFDFFGCSVAILGDRVVVGAEEHDGPSAANQGAAYVFERSGTSWTQQAELLSGDGSENDEFGDSVALDGTLVAVGAAQDDGLLGTDTGSVYVFSQCGPSWPQSARLTGSNAEAGDLFGKGVAVFADVVAAGAPLHRGDGIERQGAAYVFRSRCPMTALPIALQQAQICNGDTVNVEVSNSQPGVDYQLRDAATDLGAPVAGTGGTIVLSATMTTGSTVVKRLNVEATHGVSGCRGQLDQTVNLNLVQSLPGPNTAQATPSAYCGESGPATIQLSAGGGSGTQMQWFSGSCGGTLVGTGNPLTISAPTEATTFYARWQGLCGPSVCKEVFVDVYTPIVFTEQPNNQAACEGGVATFTVAATSHPPPFYYEWRKDFQNLSDGGHYSGVHTPTLTVSPVSGADVGYYDCLVSSGGCNTVQSNVVRLDIPSGPPNFIIHPDSQGLCENQSLSLFAAASGNPSPSYQWRRNGQDIPGATSQSYVVNFAGVSDSGTYEVVAINGCYSATSNPAVVSVFALATGDGNNDGMADGRDVPGFIEAFLFWDGLYTQPYCAYDMNEDGYVEDFDVPMFVNRLLGL